MWADSADAKTQEEEEGNFAFVFLSPVISQNYQDTIH